MESLMDGDEISLNERQSRNFQPKYRLLTWKLAIQYCVAKGLTIIIIHYCFNFRNQRRMELLLENSFFLTQDYKYSTLSTRKSGRDIHEYRPACININWGMLQERDSSREQSQEIWLDSRVSYHKYTSEVIIILFWSCFLCISSLTPIMSCQTLPAIGMQNQFALSLKTDGRCKHNQPGFRSLGPKELEHSRQIKIWMNRLHSKTMMNVCLAAPVGTYCCHPCL